MADAAARAEARRRKILENSQNRLQKITGRQEEPVPRFANHVNHEDPFPNDTTDDASIFQKEYERLTRDAEPVIFDYPPPSRETLPPKPSPENSSKFSTIFNTKLHIVILSLLVQSLYFIDDSVLKSSYMFLPLIAVHITQILFFRTTPKKSMWTAMLAISGLPPDSVNIIQQLLQSIGIILEDACVYVFTIAIVQTAWRSFSQ